MLGRMRGPDGMAGRVLPEVKQGREKVGQMREPHKGPQESSGQVAGHRPEEHAPANAATSVTTEFV